MMAYDASPKIVCESTSQVEAIVSEKAVHGMYGRVEDKNFLNNSLRMLFYMPLEGRGLTDWARLVHRKQLQ